MTNQDFEVTPTAHLPEPTMGDLRGLKICADCGSHAWDGIRREGFCTCACHTWDADKALQQGSQPLSDAAILRRAAEIVGGSGLDPDAGIAFPDVVAAGLRRLADLHQTYVPSASEAKSDRKTETPLPPLVP